jgi:transposase
LLLYLPGDPTKGAFDVTKVPFEPPTLSAAECRKLVNGCDHGGVRIAPVPLQLLPKSMASPSLLAHITTAKFDDGLPLTRQSKQFERLGLTNMGVPARWACG